MPNRKERKIHDRTGPRLLQTCRHVLALTGGLSGGKDVFSCCFHESISIGTDSCFGSGA